jgi:hypothetical protein
MYALLLLALPVSAADTKPTQSQPQSTASGFELMDVTVTSLPAGARIEIEHMPVGRTPCTMKLQPGEYRVTLTPDGYDTWEQKVTIQASRANSLTAELRAKSSKPKGGQESSASPPIVSTTGGAPGTKAPDGRWSAVPPPPSDKTDAHDDSRPNPAEPRPIWHSVKYEVLGTGSASLTYRNASGGTDQTTVRLPWSVTFQAATRQFLYLSAQKQAPARVRMCDDYPGLIRPFDCPSSAAQLESAEREAQAWRAAGPIVSAIYVDDALLQKAVATADSGIATASGKIEGGTH